MIVDDELHTREICGSFLENDGYEIEMAADGQEALDRLSKKTFDVLLSDIQMPKIDGIALLKESRSLYPALEVILMTAYGGLPSAIEAIRFEAYDYITKPLTRDILLNTVRRCVEKIELRRNLRESRLRLLEQEKLAALGAVAAWLSHRMRNSLSVILMCARYLESKMAENPSKDFKEVISAVIDKVKMLEKMTAELISYSKSYELQKSPENINTIIEDVVVSLGVQMQIKKIELVKELSPDVLMVTCDPHILHEAFENILVNALQAIGDLEGQKIVVKSEALDSNPAAGYSPTKEGVSRWIVVSISNSGSTISPENSEKIFTPFFTTKEDGSGLGLAIVRRMVEKHDGNVLAESFAENGQMWTRMKMIFPCAE